MSVGQSNIASNSFWQEIDDIFSCTSSNDERYKWLYGEECPDYYPYEFKTLVIAWHKTKQAIEMHMHDESIGKAKKAKPKR